MLDFQQKRKIRGVAYNRITLVILFILVLFFIHGAWSAYGKKRKSAEIRDVAALRVHDLQERDVELEARIERLRTDSGVEEEIRSKFTVAKEGENMVVVVAEEATTTVEAKPLSFWQKIKAIFGK